MLTDVHRGQFVISTDQSRLDLNAIHAFLTRSYWSEGISRGRVARSVSESLAFGLFDAVRQIGFARVITDRATFAYLCDVYVLAEYRGRGLGKWLMEVVRSHPDLQGRRRFVLVTRDAHSFYSRYGFKALANSDGYLEICHPDVYRTRTED